jgi:hypothetical protein
MTAATSVNSTEHMGPFYSERTLREVQSLVKDFGNGLAVVVDRERTFATIGTRGIRTPDGTPGLIIHVSLHLDSGPAGDNRPAFIPNQLLDNLAYAAVPPDRLVGLLIATLVEAGLLPPGSKPGDQGWSFF